MVREKEMQVAQLLCDLVKGLIGIGMVIAGIRRLITELRGGNKNAV